MQGGHNSMIVYGKSQDYYLKFNYISLVKLYSIDYLL